MEKKKASSPMLSLLLSQIDAYIGGESDGANIVGFVDYVFVERGFKEEVATSPALRDALNELTKNPSSSFKYAMPDYDSDDEEPGWDHKKRLRMYGFLLLALAFLAVGAVVPKDMPPPADSKRKKADAVNAKPWPLNPRLQLDFTPLWGDYEQNNFMNHVSSISDFNKRWAKADNEHFQTYREIHESDEMSFRVDVVSENPELDTKIHNQSIKLANYLLKVIDPVYLWDSSVKLNIVLSERYDRTGSAIGQYNAVSKRIWVRYYADEPEQMLDTIAHEIAHRTHLDTTNPAVPCRTGFCIHHSMHRADWSATNRQNVYLVLDEAKRVLFLGAKSKTMCPAEARLFMKIHLDTRIKEAFSASSHLEVYSEYSDAYALTRYDEFWAEASVAYIIGTYSGFPSRDQIRVGDPKLFSLLEEVYSGVAV